MVGGCIWEPSRPRKSRIEVPPFCLDTIPSLASVSCSCTLSSFVDPFPCQHAWDPLPCLRQAPGGAWQSDAPQTLAPLPPPRFIPMDWLLTCVSFSLPCAWAWRQVTWKCDLSYKMNWFRRNKMKGKYPPCCWAETLQLTTSPWQEEDASF